MNFKNTPYSKHSGIHLGELARGVSIIGAGITPLGFVTKTPALEELSDKELAAWAAQEAMEDAGVTGKDIDALCFAQSVTQVYYTQSSGNVFLTDWLGMRGKPSSHHMEACCASYCAFNEAIMAIASGKHDIVIVCGADTDRDHVRANVPPHIRYPNKLFEPASSWTNDYRDYRQTDSAYSRWNGTYLSWLDENIILYMKKYGISKEIMDDVLDALAISMRHNAANNPLALYQTELAEEAKDNGYDDVHEYLRSDRCEYWSPMHRKVHALKHSDGAGALILCASDIAEKFNPKPINILGIGLSTMDSRYPRFMTRFREESYRQIFEATHIKGSEIDLMYSTDFTMGQILQDSEMAGFVPEGEAWRYALNGDFAFDGRKPFNTQGGSMGFSHSYGVHIFEQVVEAVRQMRGECGKRQVHKIPETVFVSGFGNSQEGAAIMLRA
ncbi:thiolase family protein [Tyzzerella sp. OttesenSCG-928-J15]|nr:thiolase family protein [Tyzzerella sp. OttesenSCG-928-J15]